MPPKEKPKEPVKTKMDVLKEKLPEVPDHSIDGEWWFLNLDMRTIDVRLDIHILCEVETLGSRYHFDYVDVYVDGVLLTEGEPQKIESWYRFEYSLMKTFQISSASKKMDVVAKYSEVECEAVCYYRGHEVTRINRSFNIGGPVENGYSFSNLMMGSGGKIIVKKEESGLICRYHMGLGPDKAQKKLLCKAVKTYGK